MLSARGKVLLLSPDAGAATRQAAYREALQFNTLAEKRASRAVSRAIWEQRAQLQQLLGKETEAQQLNARAWRRCR